MRNFINPPSPPISSLKALSKRTRKSTQVFDLRSASAPLGHPLAMACVDFGRTQIRTQVDRSWSQVNCICLKCTTFCVLRADLRADLRIRLPIHHKSVRTAFSLVLQTCVDVGQGLRMPSGRMKVWDLPSSTD